MGFVKPDYELVASGVAGLQKSVGEGGGVFLGGKQEEVRRALRLSRAGECGRSG